MTTEIVWLVGRYAFLGLLYLFVLLVLRALVAELRPEQGALRPVHYMPEPAPPVDPGRTGELAAPVAPEPVPPSTSPVRVSLPPRLTVVETVDPRELPTGTTFNLTAVTTLGRGAHNSISLPSDKFASTNHALVFLREGAMYLRDRGSTNGTLVNGQRAEGEILLHEGDRVTVGTTVLRYGEGPPPAEAEPSETLD